MANDKFIFFRTAWMKNYNGVTDADIPVGGGSYITENKDGGETLNFKPLKKYYYPYVQVKGSIRIEKLGAANTDDYLDDVTIVVFAKDPRRGGERIVGWYEHARLLRYGVNDEPLYDVRYKSYNAIALVENSTLIPAYNRNCLLPKKSAGRANIWYGNAAFIKRVKKYIQTYTEPQTTQPQNVGAKRNWQADAEKRKQIEMAAMDAVKNYFEKTEQCDRVVYVHNEKLGWDLEVHFGANKLKVEVKGLQGKFDTIELTHNEYSKSKSEPDFRLCVVEAALDKKKRKVYEFKPAARKQWVNVYNETLRLKTVELTAARLSKF